jgi:prepilin-type processing-associated H-X9-DG protein
MIKKAFTIIELLVVITVGMMLAGILLGSVNKCRRYSRSILCSSNIKQLSLFMASYNNQHYSLPQGLDTQIKQEPPNGRVGNGMIDKRGWWWHNFIETDLAGDFKRDIFYCPDNNISNFQLYLAVLHGNYGVNQSLCRKARADKRFPDFTGKSLKLSEITAPAQTLLLSDSGYALINWHHVTETPPVRLGNRIEGKAYIPGMMLNADKNLLDAQKRDALSARHPQRTVNVGFADGHTERVEAEKLRVTKQGEKYRNSSPLWSQGDN